METTNIPKRLVTSIEAYRAAKKAGNIQIIPTVDSYGNVMLSTEQIVHDPFSHEESVNVVANIVPQSIKNGIESLEKLRDEGDKQNPQDMGITALRSNAETQRKQADDYEARAKEREENFAVRLADMQAWLHDAEEIEKVEKEKYEKRLTETTAAVEKKVKAEAK
jgi:hypothetical protein